LTQIETHIKVKVLPRSSRSQIIGKEGDLFKVKLTSPPVGGRANRALIEVLSKKLKMPKGSIEITSGKRSRLKTVRIQGLTSKQVSLILEK
jgi:uncharacterized protein (TIGR00251 family)